MRRIQALFIFLLLAQWPAQAKVIEQIKAQLLQRSHVEGTFKQTKALKDLGVELKSAGDFSVDRSKGLVWKQKEPFLQTIRISATKLEIESSDQQTETITKDQNPLVFAFSNVFLTLFAGDLTSLHEQFDVQVSGTAKKWRLVSSPKSEIGKKGVKKIEVGGGQYIDRILVEDPAGNLMTIQFIPRKT